MANGVFYLLLATLLMLFLPPVCDGVLQEFPRSPRRGSDIAAAAALMLVLPSRRFEEWARKSPSLRSSASSSSSSPVLLQSNETKMATSCPASCFRPNPVCGVDGVTYWCGSTDAECAGVEVSHTGFCNFGGQETGNKGVVAVQSLLLVHTIWLMLAAFLVPLGLP